MSLDQTAEGRPVHFPADTKKFSFDGEVSAIFSDMARRSIPNFYEAHAAHARMLKPWMSPGTSVLDVGASRGAFFQALQSVYPLRFPALELHAVDNSADMCTHLATDFPEVNVVCQDIASPQFLSDGEQYDVVCAHYVLQFLPREAQQTALRRMYNAVKPGGVFIYGHKEEHHGISGALAHDEYIRFRVDNGYSEEEIRAKTEALKGSMFPLSHEAVRSSLSLYFSEITETFRFMMFSTLFAVK